MSCGWRRELRATRRRAGLGPGTAPAETEAALDVADLAVGEDLAVVDDRDGGAQLLELGKNLAADHDRLAERPELTEELA